MKKISLLSIVLSILFLNEVEGQRYSRKKIDVFQASIIGGFHLSQMDGDSYTGYDKINPQFGLKSSVYLSSTLFLDVGLSYTSKGHNSRVKPLISEPQGLRTAVCILIM